MKKGVQLSDRVGMRCEHSGNDIYVALHSSEEASHLVSGQHRAESRDYVVRSNSEVQFDDATSLKKKRPLGPAK